MNGDAFRGIRAAQLAEELAVISRSPISDGDMESLACRVVKSPTLGARAKQSKPKLLWLIRGLDGAASRRKVPPPDQI
jgi:hypothetical protein